MMRSIQTKGECASLLVRPAILSHPRSSVSTVMTLANLWVCVHLYQDIFILNKRTVSVYSQNWNLSPFRLSERDVGGHQSFNSHLNVLHADVMIKSSHRHRVCHLKVSGKVTREPPLQEADDMSLSRALVPYC
jgi:hypothetical protein